MGDRHKQDNEAERIRFVYQQRADPTKKSLYEWHRPENRLQWVERLEVLSGMLASSVGHDLGAIRALDVGCGNGWLLRSLIEWGADPANLTGTEFRPDVLEKARAMTAPGVRWHLGDFDFGQDEAFDLISACTVFSSVLDGGEREKLAKAMWRMLKKGGWLLIFDFRFNNPKNPNVRKITRNELRNMVPPVDERYRTLLLAPPLARRIAPVSLELAKLCGFFLPPLRSHFIWMAQKG